MISIPALPHAPSVIEPLALAPTQQIAADSHPPAAAPPTPVDFSPPALPAPQRLDSLATESPETPPPQAPPLVSPPLPVIPIALETAPPPLAPPPHRASMPPAQPPLAPIPTPRTPEPASGSILRVECDECGLHIEYPQAAAGTSVPCPRCQQPVPLPVPGEALQATSATLEPAPVAEDVTHSVMEEPFPAAPDSQVQPEKERSFEMRLGTYWFVRVGIVMLLTGLAFLATIGYQKFIGLIGPAGKAAALYVLSGGLLGAGAWLQRKESKPSLRNYGQVLFAGGLAAVYFVTYAAHHFAGLRFIQSAVVDGVLLLAWAGFMAWLADRRKSQTLALFGLGLAYYTSFVTNAGLFTLYSNLVLTAAAVGFLIRNRWATLSYGSLVATYAGFAYWRFYHNGGWLWDWNLHDIVVGNWFLAGYWVLFTAAVFLSRSEFLVRGNRAAFLTLNNAASFSLVLLSMMHVGQGGLWKLCLAFGGLLLGLALLARRVLRDDLATRNAYLTQGLLLCTVGLVTYFTGLNLALALALESVALVLVEPQLANPILRVAAQLTAGLAVAWGVVSLTPFNRSDLLTSAAIAAAMLFNAWYDQVRHPEARKPYAVETVLYAAFALVMGVFTTWHNTAAEYRSLGFAVECTALLLAAPMLRNAPLSLGAWVIGGLSLGCGLSFQHPEGSGAGLWTGALVGGLMLFNASRRSANQGFTFELPVTQQGWFTMLALLAWLAVTGRHVHQDWRGLALAVETTLFLLGSWPLRNPTLAGGAYPFAALAAAVQIWLLKPQDPKSLGLGAVVGFCLLTAAILCKLRPASANATVEKLRLTYFSVLAQLVWGMVTWNGGPEWRGLWFAAESAALLTASRYLGLPSLRLGAHATAVVAVGVELFGAAGTHPTLWRGLAMGAILLCNGYEQRLRRDEHDPRLDRLQEFVMTTLALVVFGTAAWQHASPNGRILWLALQGSVFLVAGDLSRNRTLRWGGCAVFGCAFLWAVGSMMNQWQTTGTAARSGLSQVLLAGLLALLNSWWIQRRPDDTDATLLRPLTGAFSAAALALWGVAAITFAPTGYVAPWLGLETAMAMLAYYALRLRDLPYLAQAPLLGSLVYCAISLPPGGAPQVWWVVPGVIGFAVASIHWWQRQKSMACPDQIRHLWQSVYGLATMGLLCLWLSPRFAPGPWMAVSSLLAILVAAYGLTTRAWILATCSQLLLWVSAYEFFTQLVASDGATLPQRHYALAPIGVLSLFAAGLHLHLNRKPSIAEEIARALMSLSRANRVLSLVMALVWVFRFVPAPDQFWVLVSIGTVFFAWGGWQGMREPIYVGMLFTLAGFAKFWVGVAGPDTGFYRNLLAIVLFMAQQQIARRLPDTFKFNPKVHNAMLVLGAGSLWLYVSRLVMLKAGGYGFYLTAAWAVLALVLFAAGLGLRERIYRWHGLIILGCALTRVAVFDVWKLERIYAILSFMALGAVLLVLGFIYNKYQDKIRTWL